MDAHALVRDLYRYIQEDPYSFSKLVSVPININAHEMQDGKSIAITLEDNFTDEVRLFLTGKIRSFFDELDVIYSGPYRHSPHVRFFLNFNADKELLRIQAQPTNGIIEIVPGEYAITSSTDRNPILSISGDGNPIKQFPSYGNRGVFLLYDPTAKIGGVADTDSLFEEMAAIEDMIEDLTERGCTEFMFGYAGHDPFRPIAYYSNLTTKLIDLPNKFSFDTRTGEIGPYQATEDVTLETRLNEKTSHRRGQHVYRTFCVYKPIQADTLQWVF
jgi:hypothetical protein